MPLIAAIRPGWFEALERGIKARFATATLSVFHPEVTGRLRFELGRCVLDHDPGALGERDVERLRALSDGGYFCVRRVVRPARTSERVVVCPEPSRPHVSCGETARVDLLDAVLTRRFRDALGVYTTHCAVCPSRATCQSVTTVERNMGRLISLCERDVGTGGGGESALSTPRMTPTPPPRSASAS